VGVGGGGNGATEGIGGLIPLIAVIALATFWAFVRLPFLRPTLEKAVSHKSFREFPVSFGIDGQTGDEETSVLEGFFLGFPLTFKC